MSPACVENVIAPPDRDLGSFTVRRALPAPGCRSVGPFIFLDEMGPAAFPPGAGVDVRPHPHIGLATLTYLYDGELFHRDSLGSAQLITPGGVNFMVAGRGVVHSERTPPETRVTGGILHGLQFWLGLPQAEEDCAPSFDHYEAAALPEMDGEGFSLRLAIGTLHGLSAPTRRFWPCFLADINLAADATYVLPNEHEERALYIVSGAVAIDGVLFEPGRLVVLKPGAEIGIKASGPARFAALGGAPVDGPRFLWWNLVSSRRETVVRAREDWVAGRIASVEGDPEFIPAPELKAL
jgi:redox-sensitive bicupin YhaK (pirin superfamily)